MPPTLVLVNPHAAAGRARALIPALTDAVRELPVDLVVADGLAQALARLRAWPAGGRVVVAGGDGTVHRLLPALLAGRLETALLPCGTGNDTARALGVHQMGWRAALQHALHASARPIDIGLASHDGATTPFVSSLCVGFDAAVGERAHRAPRWLSGMPRYLWATLAQIALQRPWTVRVHCDGRCVHDGQALFASTLNTPSYGSGMPAMPAARIDDGRLDLLLAGRFGRLGTLAMMPLLLGAMHLRHPRVRAQPFTEMRIESAQPLPLAADGEPLEAATRIEVRVCRAALEVVRRPGV